MYEYIRRTTTEGRQVYVVYPLVEESEKLDLKAATAGYKELSERFSGRHVGLVHGRLSAEERNRVMAGFFGREIDILVSTTVIEVGVDAPDAGVMVIENAERFGLSQLHQLRGRIGRGPGKAVCVLMIGGEPSDIARARIEALCQHTDGFRIAEIDLELRGPGEFFGTRQHGLPELRIANPARDARLIPLARTAAFDLAAQDPGLHAPEHHRLREEFKRRFGERFAWFKIG
jgi:ATP-dependent DNA helicase RecG